MGPAIVKPSRFKKEEARMALTDNLRLKSIFRRCFFFLSSSSSDIGTGDAFRGAAKYAKGGKMGFRMELRRMVWLLDD